MSIRPARFSDLDAIVWISVAATPFDPVCDYRFPKREEYPEDFSHFSRIRMGEYMAQAATGASQIMVYEAPCGPDDEVKVISYAVWEFPKGHVEHVETKALLAEEPDGLFSFFPPPPSLPKTYPRNSSVVVMQVDECERARNITISSFYFF